MINNNNKIILYTYCISFCSLAEAKNSLPHSLIEDKYFRDAIEAFRENPNIIVSNDLLRDSIITEAKKINKTIINNLSSSKQPITIAIDGWTNVRSNKVTNLLIINNGIPYYYCGIENREDNNNTDWLVSNLEMKIIELIIFRGISNIIAITTDNEPLMRAVCKILKNKYPVMIHVPCAAHIIQLCLRKIFEIDKIKNLGKNINDIIYFLLKDNKINRVKLNDLQLADNIKNPLSLLFYFL